MITYIKKHCQRKLFVTCQKIRRVETGDSIFQESDVSTIIDTLTNHLSVLLKKINVSKASTEIAFLCRMESQPIDFCKEIEKELEKDATQKKCLGKEKPFVTAYHFFYNILNRNKPYFITTFNSVLAGKSDKYIADFIELTNQIVRAHLNKLENEISLDLKTDDDTYLQFLEPLEEQKLTKLKNQYEKYLKSIYDETKKNQLSDKFGSYYYFFALNLLAKYTLALSSKKKSRKDLLIALCADHETTREYSFFEKAVPSNAKITNAFGILKSVMSKDMEALIREFPEDLTIMDRQLKIEYFEFIHKTLIRLLQKIASDIDSSPAIRLNLKKFEDRQEARVVEVSRAQNSIPLANGKRQRVAATRLDFFKPIAPTTKSCLKNKHAHSKKPSQVDSKKHVSWRN